MGHRFGDDYVGGKVYDGIGPEVLDNFLQLAGVQEVAHHQVAL
nr:hypothetical protein [Moorella thermoacetica]